MKNLYRFLSIIIFCTNTIFCTKEKDPLLSKDDIILFKTLAHKLTENKLCPQECETLEKILERASQQNNTLQMSPKFDILRRLIKKNNP